MLSHVHTYIYTYLPVIYPIGNEKFGKYLPLNEAVLTETLFYVGLGVEFRAEHTGQLICFANDAHTLYVVLM